MLNVSPIIAPDKTQMLQHLELLFGRALLGRIEIASIKVAGEGERTFPRARYFDVGELDEAAEHAAEINAQPGCNVYVGAALRKEGTFPGGTASDDDFFRTYALFADADTEEQVNRAREVYRERNITPPFVVVTGRHPYTRAQMWWPLEEPITELDETRASLRGIATILGTDPAVYTGKQLMRLAGSIAWPSKEGRILEKTEVVTPPKAQRGFDLAQLHHAFPPSARMESGGAMTEVVVAPSGSLGLDQKVMDGREGYAFTLVTAHLHEWIGTTGSAPTIDELYRSVAPTYFKKVDQVRAGRGPEFLRQKCEDRLRAFHAGMIPFMRTLDEAVINYAARVAEPEAARAETSPIDEPEVMEAKAGLITATPYQWIDAARIPPRDVLYGRHLFRKFLSATVSPGGLGKSSLVMVEALAMVTGRALIGEQPKGRLRCWYWNGEDPMEELQRRVAAACLHYKISAEDLDGRLFMDSGRDTEIVVVREHREGVQIAAPVVDALIEQVRAKGIDVLTIDPFVASHAVNENDNTKIEAVVRQWMRVAEEGGCAVELVHHVRKPSGGAGQETTVDDARGAGALLAKVRSARVLNAMSAQEAGEIGIQPSERWAFFRVDNGKANLMPRGGDAQWRRMVGVPLGNRIDTQEDNVGVATAWEKPGVFDGIKAEHRERVQRAVAAGEWRENMQAQNWVGLAVAGALGLKIEEQGERARVRMLVNAWIKEGVLEVVEGLDKRREKRRFVVVGNGAEND